MLENKATIQTLKWQLQEAKENGHRAGTVGEPVVDHRQLWEDLQTQTAIVEKAKKVAAATETEITCLKDELRRSSDREASIRTNSRKSTTRRIEQGTEQTKILLDNHKDRFVKKIADAMAKGWEAWSAQVAELHIFRADRENWRKEGKGL